MLDLRHKKTLSTPKRESRSDQAADAADLATASERRRSLLKAAASAAPVIATLPSGAALAGSSSLQCVIKEQNGDKSPPENIEEPQADHYARLEVDSYIEIWRIQDPTNPASDIFVRVFHVTMDGEEIYVYGDNTAPGVPIMGSWFDTASATGPFRRNPAAFLYGYNATTSPLAEKDDLKVNPTTLLPSECVIDTDIPPWPGAPESPAGPDDKKHCIFPFAVRADVDTPGNVPLTHSCLTSFQRAL
jgi:hypothetical protein